VSFADILNAKLNEAPLYVDGLHNRINWVVSR